MIGYLVFAIVVMFALWLLLSWFAEADVSVLKRLLKGAGIFALVLLVAYLLLSGKFFLAISALPVLLVWFARLQMVLGIWNVFKRFTGGGSRFDQGEGASSQESTQMDRAEAYRTLELNEGASVDEIKAAYRRLISKAHPDKGGSVEDAARLNRARDILLND